MSRQLLSISSLTALLAFSVGASMPSSMHVKQQPLDDSREPELRYTLEIGGMSLSVVEGETARIEGTLVNPEVRLTAEPHRLFPYGGVGFKYPRAFTFEAEIEGAEYSNWTLSGNDFKIMYFVLQEALTPADYIESMSDVFGREGSTVSEASLSLEGQERKGLTLRGKTLHTDVLDIRMRFDIYRIPAAGDETRLLVLQDGVDENGNRSSEGKTTLQLIKETLRFPY